VSGSQVGLWAASRLPECKRADRDNGPAEGSIAALDLDRFAGTTRLATKPGMELREEVIGRDREGAERVVSWRRAVTEWRDWYKTSEQSALVLEGPDGEEITKPATNRFMPCAKERLYAKLCDLERGVKSEYDNLSTAFLTFSASAQSGAGEWNRSPANHLSDLLGSWSAVRRALNRSLEGREWEYIRMLEPHTGGSGRVSATGYAHVHVGVFVDGPISEAMFEPALEAHVQNCDAAGSEAHTLERALSLEQVGGLAAYLSKYVMKYDSEGPLEAPEHVQMFNALLWATGRRRWSVSDGAQGWMASADPEHDELELEPVAIEISGERYPLSDRDRSPVMRPIRGRPGADPPPLRD